LTKEAAVLSTLLFALLVGWSLTVPGGLDSPGAGSAGSLIQIRRRGGRAGLDDQVEVTTDGRAVVREGDQAQERELGAVTVEQLRAVLDTIDLDRLSDAPPTDPTDRRPEPDTVEYTIIHGGRTIRVLSSALPTELEPLVQLLNVSMGSGTARS
jgi:hypothetical protein